MLHCASFSFERIQRGSVQKMQIGNIVANLVLKHHSFSRGV